MPASTASRRSNGSCPASSLPASARENISSRSRMPIAASTDSSARAPWSTPRAARPRLASSIRALATASGLRSSCATKLANRDRRRRSSTSLPTSRSRSTAPPSGRGVPSTSTSRSRPDIGRRTRPVAAPARSRPRLRPLVARQRRPPSSRGSATRAHWSAAGRRSSPEDAQRRLVGEGAQAIGAVDDQGLGDRLRHLGQPFSFALDLVQRVAGLASGIGGQRRLVGAYSWPHCWPAGQPDQRAAATRSAAPARSPPASRRRRPSGAGHRDRPWTRRAAAARRPAGSRPPRRRHTVPRLAQAQPDEGDDQHDQHDVRRRLRGAEANHSDAAAAAPPATAPRTAFSMPAASPPASLAHACADNSARRRPALRRAASTRAQRAAEVRGAPLARASRRRAAAMRRTGSPPIRGGPAPRDGRHAPGRRAARTRGPVGRPRSAGARC